MIDSEVPAHLYIHLILDNYGTYKIPMMRRWFTKRPRYHLHFTPTRASWMNLVDRWFSALTEKKIQRGAYRSTRQLESAIERYLKMHNEHLKPFKWTKSADQIFASIARFCKRISDSGH